MARITWQNVAAPDFSSSMQGLRLASGMFTDAMQGLRTGMQDFQRQRQEQADASVLARALGYTDPEAFNRDIASGSLYGDIAPNSLSRDALQLLNNRSGELLINAGRQQTLDQNRYTHDRTVTQNQALDAARGAIGEFLATGSGGGNISDFYRGNADLLSQLDPEQLSNLFNRASGLSSDNLNRRNTQAIMGQRAATHKRTMDDIRDNETILSHLPAIYSNATDPEAIRDHISSLDASPRVIAGLMAEANKLVPGLYPGTFTTEINRLTEARARATGGTGTRSTGSANTPPTDAEIDSGVVQKTADFATNRATSTPLSSEAERISTSLADGPMWIDEAAKELSAASGMDIPDSMALIRKTSAENNIDERAAYTLLRNSLDASDTPVSDFYNSGFLGTKIPYTNTSIGDAIWGWNLGALGNAVLPGGVKVNEGILSDTLRRYSSQDGNVPEVLLHHVNRNVNQAQAGKLLNAYNRVRTAMSNYDKGYSTPGQTSEMLDALDKEMEAANISYMERKEVIDELRRTVPSRK